MSNKDFINDLFGKFTGDDGYSYHCNQCKYSMTVEIVKTVIATKKLLFCTNNRCNHYGIVKVVGVKKLKPKN